MKKSYCLLLACILLLTMAGTVQAKDETERPPAFKDPTRADEVEPNDDCTVANPLNLGDPMAAAITPAGDHDWFGFQASAGDCITFETAPGEDQVGGDTYLELYAEDCSTLLDSDDDDGGGLYSLLEFEFTANGVYYVMIRGYSSSTVIDAYVLMADECPPPPEENGSQCNFDEVCYDWDFAVSDHGFVGAPCDADGLPVWQYGAEMTIPGAPGNVWATALNGSYASNSGEGLLSPPFDVVAGQCDWMEIKHYVHTEWFSPTSPIYDGCNVTVNDVVIHPLEGYDGVAGTAPHCVPGEDVFAGNSSNGPSRTWGQSCFDLSEYVGQTIQVRFDFGSDGSVTYPGWYLSYVKIGAIGNPIPIEESTWGRVKSLYR